MTSPLFATSPASGVPAFDYSCDQKRGARIVTRLFLKPPDVKISCHYTIHGDPSPIQSVLKRRIGEMPGLPAVRIHHNRSNPVRYPMTGTCFAGSHVMPENGNSSKSLIA
jgi:hypothetical protein